MPPKRLRSYFALLLLSMGLFYHPVAAQVPEYRFMLDVGKLPYSLSTTDQRWHMGVQRALSPRWHLALEGGYYALRKDSLRIGSEPLWGKTDNPFLDYEARGGVVKAGLDWHESAVVLGWTAHSFLGTRLAFASFQDRGRSVDFDLAFRTHRAMWVELLAGTEFAVTTHFLVSIVPSLRYLPRFSQPNDPLAVHNIPGFGSLKYNLPSFGKVDSGPKLAPALQVFALYRLRRE
ncbi:hypothetical protein SAMN05421823_10223 [Catalinimonas alkaloidigena]|uniref:Outer membrane protein beta-barrel domain-containing protein n=1 Tax=Catalinimonas alkaloidigena TaxID=1075417 RepID=A0A1G8ZL97_9BACT|nr:hypothetical protein [Catalinimonas alkaloidigena]SDK15889.1 hypothetical protein SAMN05421823_10223 [Catalinimonas alkaloidigena]